MIMITLMKNLNHGEIDEWDFDDYSDEEEN